MRPVILLMELFVHVAGGTFSTGMPLTPVVFVQNTGSWALTTVCPLAPDPHIKALFLIPSNNTGVTEADVECEWGRTSLGTGFE
ncbi:unnamed protein product [Lota lota]